MTIKQLSSPAAGRAAHPQGIVSAAAYVCGALGSRLHGKQRDLIELEAHTLDILSCSLYSALCLPEKIYFHDLLAFGIYSLYLLLNPVAISDLLASSPSIN